VVEVVSDDPLVLGIVPAERLRDEEGGDTLARQVGISQTTCCQRPGMRSCTWWDGLGTRASLE